MRNFAAAGDRENSESIFALVIFAVVAIHGEEMPPSSLDYGEFRKP